MRFHIPGIAHTITNKDFCHCAFTMKIYKLCEMLTKLGHEVYHYGCEGSNPICTEHIDVISNDFRLQTYPNDWKDKHWEFDTQDICYTTFNANAIREIQKRQQPQDFLLCGWGWGNKPIADVFDNSMIVVESGIGYKDTFAKFRVFESYTWMSWVYGKTNVANGNFYDAVIPNYFDPNDFIYSEKKEDWFLYIGRLIELKGMEIIHQTISRIKGHIKIAGQGDYPIHPSNMQSGAIFEKVGFADVQKRKELMSKAKAVFVPTIYIEPFGGVCIESFMSGTPVISTDWGVFGENNLHGITGYRCRTLEQFEWAAKNIHNIKPSNCRDWAMNNFTMDRVALMYQEYFEMLLGLYKSGWPEPNPNRKQLDWLNRIYPGTNQEKSKELMNSISAPISKNLVNQDSNSIATKFKTGPLRREVRDNSIIMPIENEPNYSLDLKWYKITKKPGISFMLRARDEEQTIAKSIQSLSCLKIPHEINVILNKCTDNTENEVMRFKEYGFPINVHKYPFMLAKAGLEHWCCPANSVHSMVWYTNWCMMKSNFSYTFRWDADFEMTPQLRESINKINFNDDDIEKMYALYADNDEMHAPEKYMFSNNIAPSFRKLWLWEMLETDPNIPHAYIGLSGSIKHNSSYSSVKKYWNDKYWWECDEHQETREIREKAKISYNKLIEITGSENRTGARACDPNFDLFCSKRVEYLTEMKELNFFERIPGFEKQINLRPLISVNVPSRGRPDKLRKFLDSLNDTVSNPSMIEVMIRCDDDDFFMKDFNVSYPFKCNVITGPRRNGYLSCNEFHHELAKESLGELFWLANDDLECKTHGWDQIMLNEYYKWQDSVVCLYPDHSTHSNNCFPVISRTWWRIVGHVSLGPFSDAWISPVAKAINREIKIPIYLDHFLIHGPTDNTYKEGTFHPKTIEASKNAFNLTQDDARHSDIAKLLQYIELFKKKNPHRDY